MKPARVREESQTQSMDPEEFRAYIRHELRNRVQNFAVQYVEELIGEEISRLCGPPGAHKRSQGLAHRGGRQPGWIVMNGQRVAIQKQRARKDGKELRLERYAAFQDRKDLGNHIEQTMLAGLSTRSYDVLLEKTDRSLGLSSSAVSREFVKASRQSLNELNSRTFAGHTFWCIVLDGIAFGGSMVIVALGVDTAGEKHFLGISEGTTENSETCLGLLRVIQDRGIQFTDRILCVMDGSKALEKAAREFFADRVEIQLCYLHKKKNVLAKLPRKYHADFQKRYRRAFSANSFEDATREMNEILAWLDTVSFAAAESLREGLDRLLTLHRIGMDAALRESFYTTNLIDSAFSNPRSHLNRVKRTRGNTDQAVRWIGSLLLAQEQQFRRVRCFGKIGKFLEMFSGNQVAEKRPA